MNLTLQWGCEHPPNPVPVHGVLTHNGIFEKAAIAAARRWGGSNVPVTQTKCE